MSPRPFPFLAFFLALIAPGFAALPPGTPVIAPADFRAQGDADTFRLTTSGPPANPAWQMTTVRQISPPWAIQLIASSLIPVQRDDTGLLHFRARLLHTEHETGQGHLRVSVQRRGGDYQRSAQAAFDLTREWAEFHVPVRFVNHFAPGDLGVFFAFGFHAQQVEITDVSFVHYGPSVPFASLPRTRVTYQGALPDAPWRQAALERITQLRQRDLAVFVLDADGQPVPEASVSVEMQRHHFEFGTAVPFSLLMGDGPNTAPFRENLLSLFNAVGPENDLKWPFWAGDRNTHGQQRQRTLEALHWLHEREIPVRGHVLVWPSSSRLPRAVVEKIGTPAQADIPAMVAEHIRDITTATAGLVTEWDVLNEPYNHRQLMELFGDEIMVDWFKLARQHLGPDVPLYLNDWGNHDLRTDPVHVRHFIDTTRYLLARGGEVDGLGLQAHIGGIPTPPENLLATFDLYQRELGLPVRLTEFDFTTDDPVLHADYTRDFLIAAFSHPTVVGIQFWGFWEGAHWRPQAALFSRDWTERPAGAAVRQLLREQWWTRASGPADAAGRFATRAFHGRHLIRVTHQGRTVETEFNLLPSSQPFPAALHLTLPQ